MMSGDSTPDNVVPFPSRAERPRVVAVLDQADTGSRPFRAAASDGNVYWCKYPMSDHGREAVVNEVLASIVGEKIGAPVRPWTILDLDRSLVGTIIGESERIFRLPADPLFGSLALQHCAVSKAVGEVDQDSNYSKFPKLFALWMLCDAGDVQMLYDFDDESAVCSIDHGLWFASFMCLPWSLDLPAGEPLPMLRKRIPEVDWQKAIDAVAKVDMSLLDEFRTAVPPEWGIEDKQLQRLAQFVCDNRDRTIEKLMDYKQRYGMR